MTKKITITEDDHGERLDIVLASKLEVSRSQVQKMIDAKQITVNGKQPKKAGDTMKEGYVIVIDEKKETTKTAKKSHVVNQPIPSRTRSKKALVPKVISETPDFVVIEKPAGLLVHPTQAEEENTLTDWLLKQYPEIKKVGDDPSVRPGIVHRLDKEASGLMVIARTQKMFDHLKEQFKNRTVNKEYYALVHDRVERDEATINFPIARSGNTERMAARPANENGLGDDEKDAVTDFIAERHFKNFSLLRITIHSGRMHQIRVHMLAYNHPIVGDPLYFQKKRRRTFDERLGRLFLHSTLLSFTDLSGQKVSFECALPQELRDFLETLVVV
jgi:23S rRNA pseudouridine1911/1915/1917 synthase